MMRLSLWFAVCLLVACDKQEAGQPIFSLANSAWNGTFTPKADKPLQKVAMTLQSDRRFVIDVKDSISEVKGKFTEYARNKVVVFDVEQSGFDLLGTKGLSYEYAYEQSDNELTLDGNNGRYLLLRDDAETDPEQPDYAGDWTCKTNSSASIELNIDSNQFRGRRIAAQRKTLFFEGVARAMKDGEEKLWIKLVIQSSNEPNFVDTILNLKILDEKNAELTDPANTNAPKSLCTRMAS